MITNSYAKETGRAWGIAYKKVKRIHSWVEFKVPPHYRSHVFTTLLRREQGSNSKSHDK